MGNNCIQKCNSAVPWSATRGRGAQVDSPEGVIRKVAKSAADVLLLGYAVGPDALNFLRAVDVPSGVINRFFDSVNPTHDDLKAVIDLLDRDVQGESLASFSKEAELKDGLAGIVKKALPLHEMGLGVPQEQGAKLLKMITAHPHHSQILAALEPDEIIVLLNMALGESLQVPGEMIDLAKSSLNRGGQFGELKQQFRADDSVICEAIAYDAAVFNSLSAPEQQEEKYQNIRDLRCGFTNARDFFQNEDNADNRYYVKAVVQLDGLALEHASEDLRNNFEIASAISRQRMRASSP